MKRALCIFIILFSAASYGNQAKWEIPRGDIIFSHNKHVGTRSIGCTFCHETVEKSISSADKNLPTMERCFVCHNGQTAPVDCDLCHRSPEEPLALENPAREIIFSHLNHLKRDLGCEKCHKAVSLAEEMTQNQFPDMWTCMECHDGIKAPSECALCHTESERVKRQFHAGGWEHRHKFQGTQEPERCRLCHVTDQTCEECHLGDNLQQRSHALNYTYEHSLDARGKERDCMACHDEVSFCTPCHQDFEVMPEDHSAAAWTQREHADAVRRDVEACLACHETDEPTCIRCHTDRDGLKGTDPAIHGRDLGRDDEGPWHHDTGYSCYDCHDPGTMTAGEFFCGYCHGSREDDGDDDRF
ncbi:MAG: cytochrome c3 family protein [Candidatus Glassbacteria bacterium]